MGAPLAVNARFAARAETSPQPRRRQADRRAASRAKIIESSVSCLNRVGYAETSLRMIADEAGLSLGAIQHQFPTKADLMLAVVFDISYGGGEEKVPDQCEKVHAKLQLLSVVSIEQFMEYWEALWIMHTRGPAMAKLEIMAAAHSDPVFSERLKPLLGDIAKARRDHVWSLGIKAGILDRGPLDALVDFNSSAMRGLALEQLATGDARTVLRQFGLLREHTRMVLEKLMDHPEVRNPRRQRTQRRSLAHV